MDKINISGIWKLRIAITLLFVIIVTSLGLSMYAVNIETNTDTDFYNGLSESEMDQLESIFSKYPDTNISSIYEFAGLLVWLLAAGLFILMIKVWNIKTIY